MDGVLVERVGGTDSRRPYGSFLFGVTRYLVRHRGEIDIVLFHSTAGDAAFVGFLLGRVMGLKTIYKMTLVGADDMLSAMKRRTGPLVRHLFSLADGYISISSPLTRSYLLAGFHPDRLLVRLQGVDTSQFFPLPREAKNLLRKQFGLPTDMKIAIFCGAVVYRKGVDILIEAWRKVLHSGVRAYLLLVGPNASGGIDDASERRFAENIATVVNDPEFQGSVKLIGLRWDVDQFFKAADLFVFPSRQEGGPNVLLEAMAAGLPCIVSSCDGATADAITCETEGVIIQSGDPQEYAFYIQRLLENEDLAGEMSRRARARAVEAFDIECTADSYATYFHKLKTDR